MDITVGKVLVFSFLLFVLQAGGEALSAGSGTAYPWTAYFGTQDKAADWARSVRGIGRGRTGKALRNLTDEGIPGTSGETAGLAGEIGPVIANGAVIVPVGGLGSGRDREKVADFMTMIERDQGKLWKRAVYEQAVACGGLPLGKERIYWQVGNEITSKGFSESLRRWAGNSGTPRRDDPFVVRPYVESFLAPTAEALNEASLRLFGRGGEIKTLLGTIGNAGRPGARRFLKDLLEYQTAGPFAGTLTGMKVSRLVDVVGVHYVATKDSNSWRTELDEIRDMCLGRGRIKGVWATEELGKKRGRKGEGASTALKVAARYLHWWGQNSMTPVEGRCFFWGWRLGRPGTRGDDGLATLYRFLGDVPLEELNGWGTPVPDDRLESYAFQDDRGRRRVIFAFAKDSGAGVPVKGFDVRTDGREEGTPTASLHVFSAAGHADLPLAVRLEDGMYRIGLPEGFTLPPGSAGMILIEGKP